MGLFTLFTLAASLTIGQVLGGILSGLLGNCLGRKTTMLLSCLPNCLGWILLASLPSYSWAVTARLVTGVGIGMGGVVQPIYACELAEPGSRGALAASGPIVITFGILLTYVMGSFVHWQVGTLFKCIVENVVS